jgi:SAM-dependent methyltransferase
VKRFIRSIPVLGNFLSFMRKKILPTRHDFSSSEKYWEDRYMMGGNSGSGSYGRLSIFKADFINNFIEEKKIKSIVEWGCGDGNQLSLSDYPAYVGYDVSNKAIDICRHKFKENLKYLFKHIDDYEKTEKYELALSLDVIYHLVEDEVYADYMKRLFMSSSRYVVVYSYNFEKNYISKHEKGREFLRLVEDCYPEWSLVEVVKNPYPYDENDPNNTSQSDFFIFERTAF